MISQKLSKLRWHSIFSVVCGSLGLSWCCHGAGIKDRVHWLKWCFVSRAGFYGIPVPGTLLHYGESRLYPATVSTLLGDKPHIGALFGSGENLKMIPTSLSPNTWNEVLCQKAPALATTCSTKPCCPKLRLQFFSPLEPCKPGLSLTRHRELLSWLWTNGLVEYVVINAGAFLQEALQPVYVHTLARTVFIYTYTV